MLALKRLQGLVVGPDGRQTCVVASLTEEASKHFRELIGRGDTRLMKSRHKPGLLNILEECGVPKDAVHLGGPPVENVAIDEEGDKTCSSGADFRRARADLAWWSLRSVKLTLMVFGCGAQCGGRVGDDGHRPDHRRDHDVDALDALRAGDFRRGSSCELLSRCDPGRWGKRAPNGVELGWKPAMSLQCHDGIGLASLCNGDLEPIRKFGAYSALGIMLVLAVLFIYLPAALQILSRPNGASRPPGTRRRRLRADAASTKISMACWMRSGSDSVVGSSGIMAG